MAKKLESRTTLTEFAPLSPESKSQSFSIRNIFWRSKERSSSVESKQPQSYATPASESPNVPQDLPASEEAVFPSMNNVDISKLETNRSMSGILNKIMDNIIDKKKKGLQSYKDSDFKQHWMQDGNCKECYECGDRFTTFRRRHHCRVCGQIFCRRCCSQEIPGSLIGYTDDLRVCSYCCKMVLSCVKSLDSTIRFEEDLEAFHDNLPPKSGGDQHPESQPNSKLSLISPARRKSSVIGFREEDIAKAKPLKTILSSIPFRDRQNTQKNDAVIQDTLHLKELLAELLKSVKSVSLWKQEYKDHYTKIVLGCDIVDWLIAHDSTLSRQDAVNIGQAFLDAQHIECIMPQQVNFIDGNTLYKPVESSQFAPNPSESSGEIQESMEPLWVKEIQTVESYVFKDSNQGSPESVVSPNSPIFTGNFSRLSSSSSMFYLDLDVKESRVSIFKSQTDDHEKSSESKLEDKVSQINDVVGTSIENEIDFDSKPLEGCIHGTLDDSFIKAFSKDLDGSLPKSIISSKKWHRSQLREDNGEKISFEKLNSTYKHHEETLLNQLLSNEGLSLSWSDVILPIIYHVVNSVHPDVKNDADDMDIRQYVQFKKIPGGTKSESSIVSGVVFTKTVAHKKMKQRIEKPTVLLLKSSITYQRVENKFSSLDPILMQEFEYLKNTIGKLTVFKPDILLVEKTVSRVAQEMLLALGVTVALNVKPSVMERVARGTQAAIVSTVDAHLGRPQLGTCEIFKVKTYSLLGGKSKILMFFDGCPESLGCTILLRGGSANELKKVKQVVQFMVYVAYNWHLERSFLMDEFAFLSSFLDQELELDKSEMNDSNNDDINISPNTAENVDIDKNANSHQKQPLKKTKSRGDDNRKLETESISDFSDPLHSYLQLENDVFNVETCNLKVDSLPVPNTFSKLLDDIILCCSINIKPVLPHLETEAGKKCPLRKFFPAEIYWSRHFEKESNIEMLHQIDTQIEYDDELASMKGIMNSRNVEILPYHPFTSYKITDVLRLSIEFQSLLSDFRARGGTIKYLCIHERAMKEKEKKQPENNQNTKDYSKNVENSSTGLCWEKKVDALDPFNHQSLAVLFSSYSCASDNAPNYCVSPWVVKMEFYGSNDITLGGFLDRYCFRSTYICPSTSCITPMTEHVRKFVHGSGCVHILLHELTNSLQGAENNILMWSWCHKCRKATPVVSMSQDTWSFSFAKYLELRFYADSYKRRGANEQCSHSLHHDYYQYFAQNKLVAIFKYTPVFIWEVVFPAFVISVSDKAITVTALIEQIKNMAMIGHTIHSNLFSVLFSLREEYAGNNSEEFVDDMINMLKLESPSFREKIEEIQLRLTSPTLESLQISTVEDIDKNKDVCNFMWKIEDQVTLLKYHIAEVVQVWNSRIQEFISARKKEQKIQSKLLQQTSRVSEDEHPIAKPQESNLDEKTSYVGQKSIDGGIVVKDSIQEDKAVSETKCEFEKKREQFYNKNKLRKLSILGRSLSFESVFDLKYTLANKNAISSKIISKSESFISEAKKADANKTLLENEYSISSSDSSYTYGVTPGIYAGLKVSEPEDDESYVICHKESVKETSTVTVRKHHERSKSDAETLSNPNRLSLEKPDGSKPEKKERTVKSMLSQLLSSSSGNPIENPFSPSEHLLLPQNPKLPIIVYEDKPSSIIAYTLASNDYEQKLQELKLNLASNVNISQKDSLTSSPLLKHRPNSKNLNENSMQLEPHLSSDDMFDFSVDSVDKNHLKPTNKASNLHLEIQFTDSTTKFYCRIYYAEQFRKLRSLIFTEGEERYIRSLSLCVQWIARGGKSGSMFCKTHDDRFILKQMPRLELQSFMELAPSYFQYLNKAYLEQKPTLLAKILGIYRIGFKNTATNAATKMDLLVMENLFYNRNVSRKYDLKGSVRNRLVNTSGLQEDDIVLLDENLLKVTCDNPLYIRPHCKTVLTSAISNDTQFLAEQSVMDYSLLVGLDEEKGELVVGIIDYIRTFTWDKKVEMMIKSSGLLGGHGKMPTVVSPELYRMRFCEAMDSYFLWIPDRWTGLGSGIDG